MKGIALILFLFAGLFIHAAPRDSVGVRKINGRTFIQHQVLRKETIYAISQRYKVHPDSLYAFNPRMKTLKVGDIVLVPSSSMEPIRAQVDTRDQAHANADAAVNSPVMKHRVAPGETLGKIAQWYAVQVNDLQKWNNLKEGRIEPGQWLVVNASAAIVPYKAWNRNKETTPDSVNSLVVDPTVDEVTELGTARVDSKVKHALVKGMPEGGFVLISNVENNKQVIIRADKADGKTTEEGIVIYISQDVANQLGGDRHGLMLVGLRYLIVQP